MDENGWIEWFHACWVVHVFSNGRAQEHRCDFISIEQINQVVWLLCLAHSKDLHHRCHLNSFMAIYLVRVEPFVTEARGGEVVTSQNTTRQIPPQIDHTPRTRWLLRDQWSLTKGEKH